MKTKKGKLITFYGINNLGKSTQAKLLVEKLNEQGIKAEYLKYAIYDLEPSGPILNEYLRLGNPNDLTIREFQLIQILNRTQYQQELIKKLESGIWIIAEDYVGTGIAWGAGGGVSNELLTNLNSHLISEDLALYFVGERFMNSVEQGHKHETDNELTEKVKLAHNELSNKYEWQRIYANESIEKVQESVWAKLVYANFV